jgi:hypothetical protein
MPSSLDQFDQELVDCRAVAQRGAIAHVGNAHHQMQTVHIFHGNCFSLEEWNINLSANLGDGALRRLDVSVLCTNPRECKAH